MNGHENIDSVLLEQPEKKQNVCVKSSNIKLLISIFIIFIIVVSDMFTNNVISGFGEKAVKGRTPTSWGIVLQGIFLVIFYILAIYLIENHIL